LIVERLASMGVPADTRYMEDTEDSLRELKPFEFQNWVIERMNGTHAPRKTGDMGIDGFSFFMREPIQVKQSDRVGRETVDNFETAVERNGGDSGFLVAFSFTKGAVDETVRARKERGMDIRLVRVGQLLRDQDREVYPEVRRGITARPRAPEAIPSAAELIASERQSASARIREDYAQRRIAEDATPTSPKAVPVRQTAR
jgi:hypothetical protein